VQRERTHAVKHNQCIETRVCQQNLAFIFLEIGESNRNKLEFNSLCRIDSQLYCSVLVNESHFRAKTEQFSTCRWNTIECKVCCTLAVALANSTSSNFFGYIWRDKISGMAQLHNAYSKK